MKRFLKPLLLIAIAMFVCDFAALAQSQAQDLKPSDEFFSITELLQEAEQGDADAQFLIGKRYYYGYDLEEDHDQAFKWFSKAAEQGNDEAQCYLGHCYRFGYGVKKDDKQAMNWYLKSAEQNNKYAQSALSSMYIKQKDYNKALMWYKKSYPDGNPSIADMLNDEAFYTVLNGEDNYMSLYQEAAKKGNPEALATMACAYVFGHKVKQDDKKALKMFQECLKKQNLPYNDVTIADVYYDAYNNHYSNSYVTRTMCYDPTPWLEKAANLGHAEAQKDMGNICFNTDDYEQAVQWYEKASQQGNAVATRNLANCYLSGYGVTENNEKSYELFSKAANLGDARAQYAIGLFYHYGLVVEQDEEQAVYWFSKAAEQGEDDAMTNLAYCYANGEGVTQDFNQAFKWYSKGAELYNMASIYSLGEFYEKGLGVDQDFEKAAYYYSMAASQDEDALEKLPYIYAMCKDYDNSAKWYREANDIDEEDYYLDDSGLLCKIAEDIYPQKEYLTLLNDAANMGSDDALLTLACLYAIGNDVPRDDAKALELYRKFTEDDKSTMGDLYYSIYRLFYNDIINDQITDERVPWLIKAAEAGNGYAQSKLGSYYFYEEDDYDKSMQWWRKAADQGDSDAMRELGDCYENGTGVSKNHKTALQWYMKAAEADDSYSQNYIGECYLKGNGLPRNATKAAQWFKEAADSYNLVAQYNLAQCYYQGKGVKQDYMKAAEWFAKSMYIYLYAPVFQEDTEEEPIKVTELNVVADKEVKEVIKTVEDIIHDDRVVGSKDEDDLDNSCLEKANSGDPDSQYEMGEYYLYHDNTQEGLKWIEKAAKQGHTKAQLELASTYENGYYGLEADQEKAIEWYRKAAELGNAEAQIRLAECYVYELGVERDLKKAFDWYSKAADQGDPKAQYMLGHFYLNGETVKKSATKANELFRKSATTYKAASEKEPKILSINRSVY